MEFLNEHMLEIMVVLLAVFLAELKWGKRP